MTNLSSLPNIQRSREIRARAQGLIPALTQTLAKGPTQYVQGVAPIYLERGKGCRVWDVDGNQYVDLTMAVGPLSLGYAYPAVDQAIRDQLEKGITFSLMHPLEVEVGELLRRVIPGAERVRFSKTGADITSAAIRLARAYTGRDKVLCCGYHGWHDWYAGTLTRNSGVPQAVRDLVYPFPYNDVEALAQAMTNDVAAVILEPMLFDEPGANYLAQIRSLCSERGVVLVFDEMWTGFRWALGGAQQAYDVQADLACFSKALANGMPLSALTGKGALMDLLDNDVFFFTTFGGEALSLAACKATIRELERLDVPQHLAERGRQFQTGYREITEQLGMKYSAVCGHPTRSLITFSGSPTDQLLMKSVVQQELIAHGVLWNGFFNVSYAHKQTDVDFILAAFKRALGVLSEAVQRGDIAGALRGEPVHPVFRKTL